MDDEDEVRDMNLSSRPSREERRRVREREKIERGFERWGSYGVYVHIPPCWLQLVCCAAASSASCCICSAEDEVTIGLQSATVLHTAC